MNNNINNISISVVIPAFNSSKTISKTLSSVFSQTVKVDEIVITNDGSVDDTLDRLNLIKTSNPNFNIKIINQDNKGIGAARNACLKNCNSNYVAFLDSDDIWHKRKIENCKKLLYNLPKIDLLYHNEIKQINRIKTYRKYGKVLKPEYPYLLYYGNKFSPSSVIVKYDLLKEVGYFSENLNFNSAEDFDLWLKLCRKKINIFYLDMFLGSYIVSNNSITNNRKYHFNNVQNVFSSHFKKNFKESTILKNILLYNEFRFIIQELKIFVKKIRLIKTLFIILSLFNILFKSNIFIFLKILFRNKVIFKKLVANEIKS